MTNEQAEIIGWFTHMLQAASGDGGKKRAAGLKPSWKIDKSHQRAIFSHYMKWINGEKVDADSGAHPLVHMAWRCLAIAWQETFAGEVEASEANHFAHQQARRTWDEATERKLREATFTTEHDEVAKQLDRLPRVDGWRSGRVTD